jgi:hypothetical protein
LDFASGPLTIEEILGLIIKIIDDYYPTRIIVADALDERDSDRRCDLLDALKAIVQESSQLVKIFISSRDDQDIVLRLSDCSNLELSSTWNQNDINSFIRAETEQLIQKKKLLPYTSQKDALREEITDYVSSKADGM